MAQYFRAIATLSRKSGLPEDKSVNVFHFDSDDGFTKVENAQQITSRLHDFYKAIESYLSTVLASSLTVQVYDLEDPEPRVPINEFTYTDINPAGTALPDEVAVCLSFQAEKESGVDQARRRGRVYIGPLAQLAGQLAGTTADATYVVNPAFITALGTAGANLFGGTGVNRPVQSIFSPTIYAATGNLDQAMSDVADYWIDNAFDTQRRRGRAATSRTHFAPV